MKEKDFKDFVCTITPKEYELYCLDYLKGYAEHEQLKDFNIEHDVKVEVHDGIYQIDIDASFTALGTSMRVLCECKRYSSPVERSVVSELHDKLESLGYQKGILISTSGFQSGAKQYADKHGIALIQLYDKTEIQVSHSAGPDVSEITEDPIVLAEKLFPKYVAAYWEPGSDTPINVYPTKNMMLEIFKKMNQMCMKMYGISLTLPDGEYL